jgi:maltose O-acetyltransferase
MLSKLFRSFKSLYVYRIKCKSDSTEYLRHLGVKIGKNSFIYNRPEALGSEPWLVEIGNSVSIAPECFFITHDASSRLFRAQYPDEMSKFGDNFAPIIIKDNCFVGAGVIIMPGVVLEEYTIVGAGSVVTKSFPPRSVIVGVPAKRIMSYDEYVEKYKQKFKKIQATTREELRKELTMKFFGEYR